MAGGDREGYGAALQSATTDLVWLILCLFNSQPAEGEREGVVWQMLPSVIPCTYLIQKREVALPPLGWPGIQLTSRGREGGGSEANAFQCDIPTCHGSKRLCPFTGAGQVF
jgi:hypothetical protein